MFTISVRSDLHKLAATLTDLQRRQLPFATARALTATVKAMEKDTRALMARNFDKPTAWTLGAFRTIPATKASQRAVLTLKDRAGGTEVANEYLRLQEKGGAAKPMPPRFGAGAGQALVKPVGMRKNAAGNLPFKALAKAKAKPNTFVGTVRGVGGLWQRQRGKAGGLKLLVRFQRTRPYSPRFGFRESVDDFARAAFAREMPVALAYALRTARPR